MSIEIYFVLRAAQAAAAVFAAFCIYMAFKELKNERSLNKKLQAASGGSFHLSILLSWRGWDFKIIRRECRSANCVNYELWLPGVYFFIHRYTA